MVKSMTMPAAVVAALVLAPAPGDHALAQSAPLYINAVDITVVPASVDKFMAVLKMNAEATIQEPGCSELDVAISPKTPNQLFVFEIYKSANAWATHQTTAHFLKFYATTAQMMTRLDVRPFSSVALNGNPAAQAGALINDVELDIAPAQFDSFMAAAKPNGAATPGDPGAHEFNIAVSQKDPHHVLFFEVYDDAAALDAHRGTDHYKTYQATTKDMVAGRNVRQFSSVTMYTKGK